MEPSMISVIFPYWNRLEVTREALDAMAKVYGGVDMEVVVVDDGSAEAFSVDREYPWSVRVLRLPAKDVAKNPCVPINYGVSKSQGDYLVITNPEVLHHMQALPKMRDELETLGKDGYVLASAWCEEERKWHCHPSISGITLHGVKHPEGSGLHFCAMLHRSLWDKSGGFDETYREGAGYDDNDFVMRLGKVGAKFKILRDVIVQHPKTGAKTKWLDGAFQRNAEIFVQKWGQKPAVTFCCVQVGDYEGRGAEYVNKLFDMVRRNLSDGYPGRFVCVTDNPKGLTEGIQTIEAPEGIAGWWVKLWLFKRGVFPDGERVIFMDLDTVIVGELDNIAGYAGQFATLKDFYYPQQVGPAVMAWEAGAYTSSIWEEWDAYGKPTEGHGDLWWINNLDQGRFAKRCDKLQDLYPGVFVSYKADCKPYPPKSAKVVCFHGQPRPHNAPDEWVSDVWKIGGASAAELLIVANTATEKVLSNVRYSSALDFPWLDIEKENREAVCIVGGGPSLIDDLNELKVRSKSGQKIYALNGSAKYLLQEGIKSDALIMIDSRPENVEFVTDADEYLIASQCDKVIFDALKGKKVTVFHVNTQDVMTAIPENDKPLHLISGGSTVALNALAVAYVKGFRSIHCFGFDSSYEKDHHAYTQKRNDKDSAVDVSVNGRKFKAAPWMVAQVNQFQEIANQLAEAGCVITVHGYGLLPYVAQLMSQPHRQAA